MVENTRTEKNKAGNRGFSLIETFVAITILMIGVITPMSIIGNFFADSTYAKNYTVATFLVREGNELVSNKVKNNMQKANAGTAIGWLEGLTECVGPANWCNIDPGSQRAVVSGCAAGCRELVDSSGYFRAVGGGSNSGFTRRIQIEPILTSSAVYPVNQAKVTVVVDWVHRGTRKPLSGQSIVSVNVPPPEL